MTAVAPLIDSFVSACLDVFGAKSVEAIILHGSAVKGGAIPGFSDIDFMVFLTPECFANNGELSDVDIFSFQERIGLLRWRDAGFLVPQAYFYDPGSMPEWWTGPAPASYRELVGRLPKGLEPTQDSMREASRRFLSETLPTYIKRDLAGFVDSGDAGLPRRVRLLGTSVSPAIFALLAARSDDPLAIWALPKFEALAELERFYPDADGPPRARRFYDNVRTLYSAKDFDAARARQTFQTGIHFLRWVERAGQA